MAELHWDTYIMVANENSSGLSLWWADKMGNAHGLPPAELQAILSGNAPLFATFQRDARSLDVKVARGEDAARIARRIPKSLVVGHLDFAFNYLYGSELFRCAVMRNDGKLRSPSSLVPAKPRAGQRIELNGQGLTFCANILDYRLGRVPILSVLVRKHASWSKSVF